MVSLSPANTKRPSTIKQSTRTALLPPTTRESLIVITGRSPFRQTINEEVQPQNLDCDVHSSDVCICLPFSCCLPCLHHLHLKGVQEGFAHRQNHQKKRVKLSFLEKTTRRVH